MDAYFRELMNRYSDNVINENGKLYTIRVMGRGADLFFREDDRCLICSIDAEHGIIYAKSIKVWDSAEEKMSKTEKERVTALILTFYRRIYNPDAIIK